MPFCINCGAENQESNTFCVTCGHVLYQLPKNRGYEYRRNWVLTIAVSVTVVLGLAAVLLASLKKARVPDTQTASSGTSPAGLPINRDAVLTIIGTDQHGSAVSQGSGFIISADGLAVTNYHVLRGVTQATVECCGGRELSVHTIEAADLAKDLVVFQLYDSEGEKPSTLPYLTFSGSGNLSVGQRIIVIGSPQGLENTVSDGIVSAVRDYDSIDYLQITAPVSPGSSGGPVLDPDGHVVGITTFQFRKGQNLNFAVSSRYVSSMLQEHFALSLPQFQTAVAEVKKEEQEKEHSGGNRVARTQQTTAAGLTGDFTGTVQNLTSDTSAPFEILVHDSGGSLSGCMGVAKPLYGSGPLEGSETGADVTFVVSSSIGKITFSGPWQGTSIYGWYTVQHPDGSTEVGTFTLDKQSSKGPDRGFDTANCPTDADMNK